MAHRRDSVIAQRAQPEGAVAAKRSTPVHQDDARDEESPLDGEEVGQRHLVGLLPLRRAGRHAGVGHISADVGLATLAERGVAVVAVVHYSI